MEALNQIAVFNPIPTRGTSSYRLCFKYFSQLLSIQDRFRNVYGGPRISWFLVPWIPGTVFSEKPQIGSKSSVFKSPLFESFFMKLLCFSPNEIPFLSL